MSRFFTAFTVLVLFAACAGSLQKRKLLVLGKGSVTITGKEITVTGGTNADQKEIEIAPTGTVTYNITTPNGKSSIEINDSGYYILNLRPDTVVGSHRIEGRDYNNSNPLTVEQVKRNIDSLQQLAQGLNVSEANQNYFIPPGQLQRVVGHTDHVFVFGPYHPVFNQLEQGAEIYKFSSSNENRETIEHLIKITQEEK
ncbi:MAG: hypothetical protein LBE82_02205 [Chitinophagaceae bacterium]|jgi:hypothetical protein|nr:hypothetical protein [Chitinophagaceae bacterium]